MRALVIGVGAAGNKAVISLLEAGIITEEDTFLINSTLKDVPEDFKARTFRLANDVDGCAKERSVSKMITLDALKSGKLSFDGIVMDHHEKAIIITSMEGGTGSGASPIIADRLLRKYGIDVEIIAFKGFETDARGLANTVEFFQDLEPEYVVQVIDNLSFIKEAHGDEKRAQKLANEELARRLRVSLGQLMIDSEDNMDGSEMFKVTNTPGYCTVEYREIDDKITNRDQFTKILTEMVEESHSLALEKPSMYRLGVMMNLQEASQENIDYSFQVLQDRLGIPYELFKQVQYDKNQPEFIGFIASGMKLPIDEVTAIRDKYEERSRKTDKSEDEFYSRVRGMQGLAEDSQFDMLTRRRKRRRATVSDDEFFDTYESPKHQDVIKTEEELRSKSAKESEY